MHWIDKTDEIQQDHFTHWEVLSFLQEERIEDSVDGIQKQQDINDEANKAWD